MNILHAMIASCLLPTVASAAQTTIATFHSVAIESAGRWNAAGTPSPILDGMSDKTVALVIRIAGPGAVKFPGHGKVVVRGTPETLASAEKAIDEGNRRLATQVTVSAMVIGFSPRNDASAKAAFAYLDAFDGSRVGSAADAASALGRWGEASVMTKASVTSYDGIPADMSVLNTRGYLAAARVLPDGTRLLTPGSVATGIVLNVTPRTDDDQVILGVSLDLSQLAGSDGTGFDTATIGGQTIQLPNIASERITTQRQVNQGAMLALRTMHAPANRSYSVLLLTPAITHEVIEKGFIQPRVKFGVM